jgi:pimeloyl-ACP methyl ester carboxylesterase
MVEDLNEFIEDQQIKDPVIIGHSMGGKVAMNFALVYPDKLSKLIVVDISPRAYNLEHYTIAEGLKAIPIDTISSRNEADEILSHHIPDPDVRQFLLKNLQRKGGGGFSWKINLPVISEKLANVGVDLLFSGQFTKPTLFIRGARSKYISDEDWKRISEIFPMAKLETLETSHWVQAEKPQEFADTVTKWLSK